MYISSHLRCHGCFFGGHGRKRGDGILQAHWMEFFWGKGGKMGVEVIRGRLVYLTRQGHWWIGDGGEIGG